MAEDKQATKKITEKSDAEMRSYYFDRALTMEYALTRVRDSLTLISRSLEEFAQSDAVNKMEEADASVVYGAVNLLDYIIRECDEAATKDTDGK